MQISCVVKPKSKVDSLTVNPDGSFRIKIKAMPVEGAANAYLVEYLSEVFRIPRKNVEVISGFTNSHKRINIVAEENYLQSIIQNLKQNSL